MNKNRDDLNVKKKTNTQAAPPAAFYGWTGNKCLLFWVFLANAEGLNKELEPVRLSCVPCHQGQTVASRFNSWVMVKLLVHCL